MSLFAIGDTHLSFSCDKPMNVFHGWDNYTERLEENWKKLVDFDDTVVIAGDISWAMKLEEAKADFDFLNRLPGRKIIMKGNHDYWWQTKKKLDEFIAANGFETIDIMFNNSFRVGNVAVCGSRGWFFDAESDGNKKVLLREAGRLRLSIESAKKLGCEPIVFLHYPPLTNEKCCNEIMQVLYDYEIKRCYYGHLHGKSVYNAVNETSHGIDFRLISADFLRFCPKLVEKF